MKDVAILNEGLNSSNDGDLHWKGSIRRFRYWSFRNVQGVVDAADSGTQASLLAMGIKRLSRYRA